VGGGGVPLPTPCHKLTTVGSFLGFSPRERALSTVSIDNFLPDASGWPPGMISISRCARSQYSRAVIGVFAAAFSTKRDVLVSVVSLYVAVGSINGNGAVDTSRRECGGSPFEGSAEFFPLSTTRWPFLRCILSAGVREYLSFHSVCSDPFTRA